MSNLAYSKNLFSGTREELVQILRDTLSEKRFQHVLNVEKSASNIPGVKLLDAKHVNVYDILNSDKLIMTEAAIKAVEEVLA